MDEQILDRLAEKILCLDEADLTALLPQYKRTMENFQPTREWEKAVVIYFLINAVRVKNTIFNDNVEKGKTGKSKKVKVNPLKLVK